MNGAYAASQGGGLKTQITQHVHQPILTHFYGPDGVVSWTFLLVRLCKHWHKKIKSCNFSSGVLQIAPRIDFDA